ncbi:hypothetical protein C7H19_08500 [Aphanothece hegewaldii CCALA 016]|uniref:Uncharacterized protein n=1 Tax=Aphanothece hegewaldii CCALA 016 TaxID=2107694 RepID=A0A2T1LYV0_9CHRO|nr:hypothetical protein [Aphanothece hegewaldii]PSF37589.1 hypothetical protein C7H19_08500 [Aphanothece hegewaldii CCALA 016]
MNPETERIFKVLGKYNAALPDVQMFWDSEQQGKFNIWKFLVSEGFVFSTVQKIEQWIDKAIQNWRNIESRGTVNTHDEYQYDPHWKKHKYGVPVDVIKKRAKIYQALGYYVKQNFQNIEVHVFSKSLSSEYDFRVYMILGQSLDLDWFCIMPTVPDENRLQDSRLLQVNIKTLNFCKLENSNTLQLFDNVNKILTCLDPINIYGYYYDDNGSIYKHQLICTTSDNKIKAIKLGLQASGLLTIDRSISEITKFDEEEVYKVEEIMEKELKNCRRYAISLWNSGYEYYLGQTKTGDWIGFQLLYWSEYNP